MPIPISNTKVLDSIRQCQAFCNTLVLELVLEAGGWDRVKGSAWRGPSGDGGTGWPFQSEEGRLGERAYRF